MKATNERKWAALNAIWKKYISQWQPGYSAQALWVSLCNDEAGMDGHDGNEALAIWLNNQFPGKDECICGCTEQSSNGAKE